jgi:uncharacterized heparinase superfamily protein
MIAAPPIVVPHAVTDPPSAADRRLRRVARFLRTARYLTLAQLAARARFVALRRLYALAPTRPIDAARRGAAGAVAVRPLPAMPRELLAPEDAGCVAARAAAFASGRFVYLGREADYGAGIRWRDPDASPLWAFNLHYLGCVLDLALAGRARDAQRILASWDMEYGTRWDRVAWHPYPVSLRLTNLCFAAAQLGGFDALGAGACGLAATHAAYLLRHLERDLRGNHLLENACALLVAGTHLDGSLAARCRAAARVLLVAELCEQVRPDGSHFELSPMYHSIVMQRLLQALALLDGGDPLAREVLMPAMARMARFLAGIACPDGDIPPLGDAVRGVAPPPAALLALADRHVGARPAAPIAGVTSFADAGLHVFRAPRTWAVLDAGPVCPDYLPGHGQADSLTVEVWCDGTCVVGDPGVHEYTGPERAWGRSSRAHSTMTVDDADTSEVYDSFRVGGRARIAGVEHRAGAVSTMLEPFGVRARLARTVRFGGADTLEILDSATVPAGSTARSRLHLHPAVDVVERPTARTAIVRSPVGFVRIDAEQPLHTERGRASRRYGVIEPTTILVQPLLAGPCGDRRAGRFSITPLSRHG